jgi:arginine exporter protein ArgO
VKRAGRLRRAAAAGAGAEGQKPATELFMGSQMTTVLYFVLMVAVIVALDVLFFRNHFWERLAVNVGIVLVFAAFYFRFLKRP